MRKFSFYLACLFTLVLMGCGDTSGDPTAQITTLKAEPADVAPGSSTVITATVVKAVGNKADATAEATVTAPGWGENVTFRLLTANGGQLSSLRQKTDGKGEAKTVYTAGNNLNNDTIQAILDNGMSATIVIKKTGNLVGIIISSFVASPTTLAEGQTSVITAKVTDGGGANPMLGEPVTFTMATNESDGCFISATNACVAGVTVNSNAGGNAVAIYRAGGNKSTEEVYDTVRGTLANGSSNAVIITRSSVAPVSIAVVASPASVNAGQASIVTATLTGNDNVGVTVAFSLPVNNSGATLSASSAVTDGSGKAVVTYTAGANNPAQNVSDSVQAAVGSISSSATITRIGSTATLSIAVTASPSFVNAGQASIITATLTGDSNVGATVTFSLPVNNSGATLSASSAVTDGSGRAVVTYTAGANNPTLDVSDSVRAAVGSISNSAAITRVGTATTSYAVTVIATPNPLSAINGSSVVMANVTNNLAVAISGVIVTFTTVGGSINGVPGGPGTATTDGSGNAVALFSGGGGVGGATVGVVTASITISGNPYAAVVVITNP